MWKLGNSFSFISEMNKGTQRLTHYLRVSQVYNGIKKGDAEHLCLATVLEMQLKTAPKLRLLPRLCAIQEDCLSRKLITLCLALANKGSYKPANTVP